MTYAIRTHKRQPDPDLIQRQAAADAVMLARRASIESKHWTLEQRRAQAEKWRAIALELNNAADYVLRGAPEPDHVPLYLLSDEAARFHK
jgi:hypothetical protein